MFHLWPDMWQAVLLMSLSCDFTKVCVCAGGVLSSVPPSLLSQENRTHGCEGSPPDTFGQEGELAGSGTYMRFDVPQAKIKHSWPSFRGNSSWMKKSIL